MSVVLVFFACFIQLGLLTLQSINVNNRRYTHAFFTSVGVSCVAVFASVHVIREPELYFFPYLLGNCFGVVAAMKLDEKIIRRNQ